MWISGCLTQREKMELFSRRSYIGGEGLPSRDQFKANREHRHSQSGFQHIGDTTIESCCMEFPYSL